MFLNQLQMFFLFITKSVINIKQFIRLHIIHIRHFYIDGIHYEVNDNEKTVSVIHKEYYRGSISIPCSVKYGFNSFIVTNIGYQAFWFCTQLTTVFLPNTIRSIDKSAFNGCYKLSSIIIPDNVETIGEYAFSGCSLIDIIIPNNVKKIGDNAFENCTHLISVFISASVINIGSNPFIGCCRLSSIVVDTQNRIYDSRSNCNAIIKTASNALIAGCIKTSIPEGINIIDDYSFMDLGIDVFAGLLSPIEGLKSILIPNSVSYIGLFAFAQCSSLKSITIPEGIKCICHGAFQGYLSLKSIILNDGLRRIGPYAFSHCSNLTTIIIPNSVETIDEEAFYGCKNLSSVCIGFNVKVIKKNAFAKCEKLTNFICLANVPPTTEKDPFYGLPLCNDFTKNTLYVPIDSIEKYKTSFPWKSHWKVFPLTQTPQPLVPSTLLS